MTRMLCSACACVSLLLWNGCSGDDATTENANEGAGAGASNGSQAGRSANAGSGGSAGSRAGTGGSSAGTSGTAAGGRSAGSAGTGTGGNAAGGGSADESSAGSAGDEAGAGSGASNDAGSSAAEAGSSGGGAGGKGDDAPPSDLVCPSTFTACGGALAGTWKTSAYCATVSADELRQQLMCPTAEIEATFGVDGTYVFNNDGTFQTNGTSTSTSTITLPKSCITAQTGCAVLGMADADDKDGATSKVTETDTACVLETSTVADGTQNGTWATSNSQVTLTSADPTKMPASRDYCVTGDVLTIKFVDDTGFVTYLLGTRE